MAKRADKSLSQSADAEDDGLDEGARGDGDARDDEDEDEPGARDDGDGDDGDGDGDDGDDEVEAAEAGSPLEEKARKIADRVLAELRWAGPVAVLAVALGAGRFFGPSMAALVLAGGALVGAITIFWASLRSLVGESELSAVDAYLLAVPAAEEEKKRSVLRSLKDIEFERSVGKLSDDDYRELSSKLRDEAKRLLRAIDEGAEPRRKRALELADKHLRAEGLRAPVPLPSEPLAEPAPRAPASAERAQKTRKAQKTLKTRRAPRVEVEAAAGADEQRFCSACGVANDPDAVFCKRCGAKQAPAGQTPSETGA